MFKDHCKECEEKLGKPFDVVHRWLDEYAKLYFPSTIHRAMRHHIAGVEEVRHKWGDEAAKAAELHILADMKDEGVNFIPDEKYWQDRIDKGHV